MLRTERAFDELRKVEIVRGYTEMTPGSVLISVGRTRVLCTVSLSDNVPPWMRDRAEGWVTAEYSMLPGSASSRINRKSISGGRTKEIQRLIGRSLRAGVALEKMTGISATVDCDVLQADGGTRTASITGAWIALADAFDVWVAQGKLAESPITTHIAATSVGLHEGQALLDLEYVEDVAVDVDCNVVMTGDGRLVEVQGTAEGDPFSRQELNAMLDVAAIGIDQLVGLQTRSREA